MAIHMIGYSVATAELFVTRRPAISRNAQSSLQESILYMIHENSEQSNTQSNDINISRAIETQMNAVLLNFSRNA